MAKALGGTSKIAGGRVTEIQIDPQWVRFAVGSALRQAGTAVADCTKLTLSMGVRAPQPGDYAVLEFGDAASNRGASSIGLHVDADPAGDYVAAQITSGAGGADIDFYQYDPGLEQETLDRTEHTQAQVAFNAFPATPGDLRDKCHVFLAVDLTVYDEYHRNPPEASNYYAPRVALWINGVDRLDLTQGDPPVVYLVESEDTPLQEAGVGNTNLVTPPPAMNRRYINKWLASVAGFEIAVPIESADGDNSGAIDLSNVQVWFGQFIDPEETTFAGRSAKPDQPPYQGRTVNANYIKALVDGANGYGLDPWVMLTFANVESQYNPNDRTGSYMGTFQFDQPEMNRASAAQGSGNNPWSNSDQLATYKYFMQGPWTRKVIQFGGLIDTTGVYRYLVHNQGEFGFDYIMNAYQNTPNVAISTLTSHDVMKNMVWGYIKNGRPTIGQAWSNRRSGITKDSTVAQWMAALINFWNIARAEADSRLGDPASIPNIDFFYKDGALRITAVAQDKFGQSDIVFDGPASNWLEGNFGSGGDFVAANPEGITDAP